MKNVARVKEQSSTTGLSSYDLSSSGALFRRFRDEHATAERVRYYAASTADFEEGLGVLTYGSPDTLSRDTILRSSQSGAKINWPTGTRDLFVDPLPGSAPVQDKSGAYTVVFTDHGSLLRFTGSSGATFTLTAAAALGDGFSFEVYNAGTADVTIDPNAAETINGGATLAIAPGRGALVRCSGTLWVAQPTGTPASAALVADMRNAVVKYASASTLTITADEVILKDASAGVYLASTVSLTATITTSGANGLDTGAEAASTWYYVWVIYNGTTVACLLSVSSTAPTMPSGYTYKALVGTVRNDGSSNFIRFHSLDRVTWLVPINIFTSKAAGGIDTYEVLASTDLTNFQAAVPPIAKSALGTAGTVTANAAIRTVVAGDTNGVGASMNGICAFSSTSTQDGFAGSCQFDVPIISSQNLAWKNTQTTAAENRLNVSGYRI